MLAQHKIVSKQHDGYRCTRAGMPVSTLSPWSSPMAGIKDMTQQQLCSIT